jgi:hypothetical protein
VEAIAIKLWLNTALKSFVHHPRYSAVFRLLELFDMGLTVAVERWL